MTFKENLETRIKKVKVEIMALWYAARDSRTPWVAKALALLVTAYAFSPVDLIPDFIPLLGYLDDLILIPAGIALAVKLIPDKVMAESRAKAMENEQKPVSIIGGIVIGLVWLGILFVVGRAVYRLIWLKD